MGSEMAEEGQSSADDGVAAAVYSELTSLHSGVESCFVEVHCFCKGM